MDDGPGVMPDEPEQSNPIAAAVGDGRPANGVPSKRTRGRPAKYGYRAMRRSLSVLTTKRLDGRSAVAVAVRRWKEDVQRDLGGDLSRAQETILEAASRAWIILASLDDYIGRQPSLVNAR